MFFIAVYLQAAAGWCREWVHPNCLLNRDYLTVWTVQPYSRWRPNDNSQTNCTTSSVYETNMRHFLLIYTSSNQSAPSGYYSITTANGSAVQVYCDMEETHCGGEGGWTRVNYINKTQAGAICPLGLEQISCKPRNCKYSWESDYFHLQNKLVSIYYTPEHRCFCPSVLLISHKRCHMIISLLIFLFTLPNSAVVILKKPLQLS